MSDIKDNTKTNQIKTIYKLHGGGEVTVLKPFGQTCYSCVVNQDGTYPELGYVAVNINRQEFSFILEGEFVYTLNDSANKLKSGDTINVPSDVNYTIEGKGKILVIVKDQEQGRTEIRKVLN